MLTLIMMALMLHQAAPVDSGEPADPAPTAAPCSTERKLEMIPLDVEITDSELAPVVSAIDKKVADGDKQIMLRITSPGGDLKATWNFVQHMENIQAKGVTFRCVADIEAASGAFTILQACDERLMTYRTMLLEHHAHAGLEGTPAEIRDSLRTTEIMDMNRIVYDARRLKMPLRELLAKIDRRDWSMGPDEALKVNAVDGIVKDIKTLPPLVELSKPATIRQLLGLD